jgi:hypothetical protein
MLIFLFFFLFCVLKIGVDLYLVSCYNQVNTVLCPESFQNRRINFGDNKTGFRKYLSIHHEHLTQYTVWYNHNKAQILTVEKGYFYRPLCNLKKY